MKLETTWNEHGKIWHYFTTSREAQAARVEGVVFKAAVGLWRSIAAYACKSCGTETDTHTPDCERAPATKDTVLDRVNNNPFPKLTEACGPQKTT